MFISFFRYLQGYVKILIIGYSPERFLNMCRNKNLKIWGLESTSEGYVMCMKVLDFKKIKSIIKKTQTKVSIIERFGLPFFFHRYRKRKLFFIGLLLSFILMYSLTFFVWNIDFVGNSKITDEVFLEYLEKIHVSHGMPKGQIDCEKIAKDIRNHFDDVIWVSVSIDGTKLMIHIKERDKTLLSTGTKEPCDIISNKAGVVTDIITRSGIPQVKVGDEVKNGDILISGTIDVLNDAKEVVSQNYVTSDADIILETHETYEDFIAKTYKIKKYTDKKKTIRYLKLGKFIIHLGFGKTKYKHFEQTTEESQLKLNQNFYLPIYWGKKQVFEYKIQTKEHTQEELDQLLIDNFTYYCENLESQNVMILKKEYQIIHSEVGAKLNATLKLKEEVGIERKIVDLSSVPMVE